MRRRGLFTTIFAVTAGTMALAPYLNSRIVERAGTRRVSHAALLGFIAVAGTHGLLAAAGHETVWMFAILQSGTMFCFGLVGANFNSMAMEPLGHIAGTGSSVLGTVSTLGGALIGFYVGQQFDGSVIPLMVGFVSCGLASLFIVALTERESLFKPTRSEG